MLAETASLVAVFKLVSLVAVFELVSLVAVFELVSLVAVFELVSLVAVFELVPLALAEIDCDDAPVPADVRTENPEEARLDVMKPDEPEPVAVKVKDEFEIALELGETVVVTTMDVEEYSRALEAN